jgi:hypothetical protein
MQYFNWVYRNYKLILLVTFPSVLTAQINREKKSLELNEGTNATSDIEQRISITSLTNFCFGAFYPGRFGGSIEVNKNGVRSSNGSAILLHSELNTSAAVFEIHCPSFTMVNIMIEKRIILQNESGNTIVCEPIEDESLNFVSPSKSETGFIYSIGARIIVSDETMEKAGDYSGKFNVFIVLE